jgi:hypothetical protein
MRPVSEFSATTHKLCVQAPQQPLIWHICLHLIQRKRQTDTHFNQIDARAHACSSKVDDVVTILLCVYVCVYSLEFKQNGLEKRQFIN